MVEVGEDDVTVMEPEAGMPHQRSLVEVSTPLGEGALHIVYPDEESREAFQ